MNTTSSTDTSLASRKRMRERTIELAIRQGRSAHETTKADWEQAKQELAREPATSQSGFILALSRRPAGHLVATEQA